MLRGDHFLSVWRANQARLIDRAAGFFDIGNGIMLDIKQDKNTERRTKKGRKIDLVTAIINLISALILFNIKV